MSEPPPPPPDPDPEPRPEGDPPLRERFRSGVVVVVLEPRDGAAFAPDLLGHARDQGLTELAELLAGADLSAEPAIARERVGQVLAREERARSRNPQRSGRSLTLYWRLDAVAFPGDLAELARRIAEFDGVDSAYAEQAVVPAPSVPVQEGPVREGAATPEVTPETSAETTADPAPPPTAGATVTRVAPAVALMAQGHLDPAPVGVGARGVWGLPGGTGSGRRVVDVEQGWAETHPALAGFTVAPDPPRVNRGGTHAAHGTQVVAVVAAAAGVPVLGVGADVQVLGCSHWDGATRRGYNVVAALDRALDLVDPDGGDVLLLEVQRHDEDGRELPTETDQGDLDAIVLARDLGTVVVEAGGNGNRTLDTWSDPATGRTFATDSGAVVVGASASAGAGGGHPRWTTAVSGSTWGARIDCHAWGEGVATATVVAGAPGYTSGFGGTSSASAIVAGVAAVVQAMHVERWGFPLAPGVLRHLLRTVGTPQSPAGAAEPIGVQPDLEALAAVVRSA